MSATFPDPEFTSAHWGYLLPRDAPHGQDHTHDSWMIPAGHRNPSIIYDLASDTEDTEDTATALHKLSTSDHADPQPRTYDAWASQHYNFTQDTGDIITYKQLEQDYYHNTGQRASAKAIQTTLQRLGAVHCHVYVTDKRKAVSVYTNISRRRAYTTPQRDNETSHQALLRQRMNRLTEEVRDIHQELRAIQRSLEHT